MGVTMILFRNTLIMIMIRFRTTSEAVGHVLLGLQREMVMLPSVEAVLFMRNIINGPRNS